MAKGSLLELQGQMIISNDLGYIDNQILEKLNEHIFTTAKLIAGLIKSAMDRS